MPFWCAKDCWLSLGSEVWFSIDKKFNYLSTSFSAFRVQVQKNRTDFHFTCEQHGTVIPEHLLSWWRRTMVSLNLKTIRGNHRHSRTAHWIDLCFPRIHKRLALISTKPLPRKQVFGNQANKQEGQNCPFACSTN